MPVTWFLALQAVAGPPAPLPAKPRAPDRPCPVAQPGEDIVVCARPDAAFRLKPLPDRYTPERAPPKAQVASAGVGTVALEGEQGADAQGGPIPRAMVRLRIPLSGASR